MLGPRARQFIGAYEQHHTDREALARLAEDAVRNVLEPMNLEVHLIGARAKSPSSAFAKIRRKSYGNPGLQLTDAIGVRVITYYQDDVDRAARAIRDAFEIDERRSVDKRHELQLRQFGYRSVHLIARLPLRAANIPRSKRMKKWFEIQVRSILEHAWAEIEHEVCYKSGISYPESVLRRFGALAGAMEILEAQFLSLRREREKLIDLYRTTYERGLELREELDTARLVAFMEAVRPNGVGWRTAAQFGRPFARGLEGVCVELLRAVGIRTARRLGSALESPKARRAIQIFASLSSVGAEQVSHLAVVVIAAATTRRRALNDYLELLEDARLMEALESAR